MFKARSCRPKTPRKGRARLSRNARRIGKADKTILDFRFWILDWRTRRATQISRVCCDFSFGPSKMENRLLMGDGLRRNAGKFPLKVAAKDNAGQITYGELNARVNRLAHGLLSLGVRKGDEVAVSVGNRIEHLEILFATAKIGALAIPLDVKWKALELASVLSAFAPRFIIAQEDCLGELAKARESKDLQSLQQIALSSDRSYSGLLAGQSEAEPEVEVHEDDPFAVMLTSGTTGFPKGCLTTHRTFVFHCINNAIEKGLGAHDTAILSSPIYFN